MTLRELAKAVSAFFLITEKDMLSSKRETEFVMPRHIWRVIAKIEFEYNPTDIAKYQSTFSGTENKLQSRSTVYSSVKKIIHEGVWAKEYEGALQYIREQFPKSPIVVNEEKISENDIIRVTKEAFDERFYGHPEKINKRTGNKWFPAFHFIYNNGAPTEHAIESYKKDKGWEADRLFYIAQVKGSYVHNRIEDMGKYDIDTTREQIYRAFPDPKEARKVEECLQGFLNWVNEEEPIFIGFESMLIAEDWGGTVDLRCKLKYGGNTKNPNNYKDVFTVDFKTSKSAFKSHLMQVEVYREVLGDDKAAVLVLGNTTAKRYTFTVVKDNQKEHLKKDWHNIKELAYERLINSNRIKPHENDMPSVFSLKEFKKKESHE